MITLALFVRCEANKGEEPIDPNNGNSGNENIESPLSGYKLEWSDEFNGAELDQTKWKFRIGPSEASYQRSANVSVEDGCMVISLKKESYKKSDLTGGGIITKSPNGYGYYEIKAKLAASAGWHESFWTTGLCGFEDQAPLFQKNEMDSAALEIDCFEHKDYCAANQLSFGSIKWEVKEKDGFISFPKYQDIYREKSRTFQGIDVSADFYTYGFEFTPDYLNFYFNGELLKTLDARKYPKHDFYIWLSAIATDRETAEEGKVFFDYIRAFKISEADYQTRKQEFINKLNDENGNFPSNGTDYWIEAEDFIYKDAGWIERTQSEGIKELYGTSTVDGTQNAYTNFNVSEAGNYVLWVRNFDRQGYNSKINVSVNGSEEITIGEHDSEDYKWERVGKYELKAGKNKIELKYIRGGYPRCDKLLLTTDENYTPKKNGCEQNVEHID